MREIRQEISGTINLTAKGEHQQGISVHPAAYP